MRIHNTIGKVLVFTFLLILAINCVYAQTKNILDSSANSQAAYNEGILLAEQKKSTTSDALKNFDTAQLPNFTANPYASKHYGGVTQKNDDLSAAAQSEASKSSAAQAVVTSFAQRPLYKIDKNTPEMQKSQFIINNAQDIARGQHAGCQKESHESCKLEYVQDICSEGGRLQKPTCTKQLVVEAERPLIDKDIVINVIALSAIKNEAWITIDLKSGAVVDSNVAFKRVDVKPTLADIPCDQLSLKYLGYTSISEPPTALAVTQQPTCANGLQATFVLDSGQHFMITGGAAIVRYHLRAYDKPIIHEHWVNNCTWLDKFKGCRLASDVCSQGRATRIISGVPVTRDCWEITSTYDCTQTPITDTCTPLRDKGCEQIGSQCLNKVGDLCMEYQQIFQCPTKKCSEVSGIVCGGKFFCLDGDCSTHDYEPSKDFEKSISSLSAMAAVQKEFDEHFIFKGSRATCDNTILGFNNCCRDSGWGQDLHLAHCSDEEKKLGQDKEKNLTTYIGEYCSKKFLGVCLEHKKSYCSFASKLARLVQEQGRRGQLGIGFGDAENTDCRGLTPEEMQRIDFSTIDFSEFYADLNAQMKMPDVGATNQRIADRVKEQYEIKK